MSTEMVDEHERDYVSIVGDYRSGILSEVCQRKILEDFEQELKNANITILCINASSWIELERSDDDKSIYNIYVNKRIAYVCEKSLVTTAFYMILNKILIDLLTKQHNFISIRDPLNVEPTKIDGKNMYQVSVRYLTGKDIDEKAFKREVKRLASHIDITRTT